MMFVTRRNSSYFLFLAWMSLLLLASLTTPTHADLNLDGGNNGWDIDDWWVQVDGVMGGKSSGFLNFEQNNSIMSFSGTIVLDGGGFSSIRKYLSQSVDLSNYAGIVVEMDTHVFNSNNNNPTKAPVGLHLQLGDETSRWGYASAFAVPLADEADDGASTSSVFLPLETLDRATRSGFRCQNLNSCILDTTRIDEIDIYVLFQEGTFNVNIRSITAVHNVTSFASPIISTITTPKQIRDLIDSTIKSGGKLYDYGYHELCIAIYRSTLNSLMAASSEGTSSGGDGVVTNEIKILICDGLQQAGSYDRKELVDIAWSLRRTLDGVIETINKNMDIEEEEEEDVLTPIVSSSRTTGGSDYWQEQYEQKCIPVTSFPPVYDASMNGTIAMTGNYTRY